MVEVDRVLLLTVHLDLVVIVNVDLDLLAVHLDLVVIDESSLDSLPLLLFLLSVGHVEEADNAKVLDFFPFLTPHFDTLPFFGVSGLCLGDIIAASLEVSKLLAAGAFNFKGLALFLFASFWSSTESTP